MHRRSAHKRSSAKKFRKQAGRTHVLNKMIARGGFRL